MIIASSRCQELLANMLESRDTTEMLTNSSDGLGVNRLQKNPLVLFRTIRAIGNSGNRFNREMTSSSQSTAG